jgi:choline dehydrogenase-like flavoprotein
MLLDAKQVASGTTLEGDVCVIGAGAAGITLSRALAAKGRNVLLLESGGFEPDADTQALYRGKAVGLPIDPKEDFGLDAPRLRFFGGTTNHWAGFCRPFPELDFQPRSYVPRSGWPIARADLDPHYAGAHDVIRLGPYDYSLASWQDQGHLDQPFLDDATTPHAVFQVAGHPVLGSTYRKEIVDEARIKLVLWANVTRIALDTGGNAVEHLDVKTLDGNSFTARAKLFVLATGGLEIPRLLLASNDRRPAGIGNERDQVGRSFMEHVNIVVGPVPLTVGLPALKPYELTPVSLDVEGETRDFSLQTVVLVDPDLAQRDELRACEITLEYPFAPSDAALEKLYPGLQRGLDLMRAEGMTIRTVATARVLCEQEPNPASRVTLVRTKDRLGMPRIELDWRLTRDDRASLLRTLRFFGAQVAQRGYGRFRLDITGFRDLEPGDEDDLDFEVNTGSHHIGTARMSTDPAQGVVDPDLKVHSVANLYVGGSAVFPTSGANPPTLTIVALALRLGDHLDTLL